MADETPPALPPEEEAYYAAWLGKLWPRYRARFVSPVKGAFEWRAAVYPLWLVVPGLYRPLAGCIAVLLATSAAVAVPFDPTEWQVPLLLGLLFLALWPLAIAFTFLLAMTGQGGGTEWMLGPLMLAGSGAVGMLAPHWIVAEGRRRWRRHAERTAAGAPPPLPRAITAGDPVRLVVLLLLVVVPVWLVLFQPHGHDKNKAYVAAMKSDLRNLVTAQEAVFADSGHYATTLDSSLYRTSTGVRFRIVSVTDSGWSAVASHTISPDSCGIFVGRVAAPVAGGLEGEPRCARPAR